MSALVKIQQGYRETYYKFDDEISAIQFATISKEHVIDPIDHDGNKIKTMVSVLLDIEENDIDD